MYPSVMEYISPRFVASNERGSQSIKDLLLNVSAVSIRQMMYKSTWKKGASQISVGAKFKSFVDLKSN